MPDTRGQQKSLSSGDGNIDAGVDGVDAGGGDGVDGDGVDAGGDGVDDNGGDGHSSVMPMKTILEGSNVSP